MRSATSTMCPGWPGWTHHKPCLLLGAPTAAVPVLHRANGLRVHSEGGQLWSLPQGPLEFGEPGKRGESDHVVPQRGRLLLVRQPADDRTEERGAVRRLEVQDRRSHVAAGQRQGLLGLRSDLVVERAVL